jgi:hypothetical protein
MALDLAGKEEYKSPTTRELISETEFDATVPAV